MYPHLVYSFEKRLPSELTYWFINDGDKIKLFSNAIKTPDIYVYSNNININGKWVYWSGQRVIIQKDENIIDSIEYSDPNVVDFTYIDNTVRTIEKDGNIFIYNGNKFTKYYHKYGFIVLENKNKFVVIVNGREFEYDRPVSYRITPSFINLVYNNESVVINTNGDKIARFRKPFYYLGRTSKGTLFQIPSGESIGKIISEEDPDLFSICRGETEYIGESMIGIIISCNKKLKYYSDNSWTTISNTSNLLADFANNNFVSITDSNTIIYPGDSLINPLFTLPVMHSVFADRRYIYLISESKKFYVIEVDQDYTPFTIIKDRYNMVTLSIEKPLYESLKLGKGLVQIKEGEEGNKVIVRIEPNRLSVPVQSKIQIDNEIIKYVEDINISQANIELEPISAYIIASEGGRLKNKEGYYNAILKVRVRYKIPTKLKSFLKIKVQGKEYSFLINKIEGDITHEIPLLKTDMTDEIITISIERNGYIEASKEFPVKVKELVKDKKDYKTFEVIDGASRKVVKKSENGEFEWGQLWEYPDPYDNVIIAKAGSVINLKGQKFEVRPGIKRYSVERNNYRREYIIQGLTNPIKDVRATIDKNKINLEVICDYKVLITAIYGTQIQTNSDGKFIFALDPFYSTVLIKVFYANDIKWDYIYQLKDIKQLSVNHAITLSSMIKQYFEDSGILQ